MNIVFVLVDDLRHDTMGFLKPGLKTPNIDRLAEGRGVFPQRRRHHSLCSPSRAKILTGQSIAAQLVRRREQLCLKPQIPAIRRLRCPCHHAPNWMWRR